MNQLTINKEIWGYNFESFLDQEIPRNIFQDDLKILNSEKFENETLNIFGEYINKRLESFKQQLEKIKEQ